MDVGGSSGVFPVNNKQKAMLPNKARGEFTRNARKDSEVRKPEFLNECPAHESETGEASSFTQR